MTYTTMLYYSIHIDRQWFPFKKKKKRKEKKTSKIAYEEIVQLEKRALLFETNPKRYRRKEMKNDKKEKRKEKKTHK